MINDLIVPRPFAEIKEVELDSENDNVLRVWCRSHPDSFAFQIRTHKPITEKGTGKPRDMIATVELTIKEFKEILEYMEKNKDPLYIHKHRRMTH